MLTPGLGRYARDRSVKPAAGRRRVRIVQIDGLPPERRLVLEPVEDVALEIERLRKHIAWGETPAALYSLIICWAKSAWRESFERHRDAGGLELGSHLHAQRLNSAMLSLCVMSVPLVGPE